MNKAELIEKIATASDSTRVHVESILDSAIHIITQTVAQGEEVKLVGFGTLYVGQRKARLGRNPQSGKVIQIPAARVPRLRPGKEFKDLLNRPLS